MSPDVGFVEVRLFDLNPLIDIGIASEQSTFADVFLLMCLFRDSPPISSREQPFRPLAHELFEDMQLFAEMLDTAYGGSACATALNTRTPLPLRKYWRRTGTMAAISIARSSCHSNTRATADAATGRRHSGQIYSQCCRVTGRAASA